MTADPMDNPASAFPSRRRIAELIVSETPDRNTFAGWQHYRLMRELLVPPPLLTPLQWSTLPVSRRTDYDSYRQMTNVNLPLQVTPMADQVFRLIARRLNANTRKKKDPTLAGVMISGWGQHGKTATVCSAVAAFEDSWLKLCNAVDPAPVPGTLDLHSPIVYVTVPVTAKPKSTCEAILDFFGAPTAGLNLPQLVRQVALSLKDHRVKVLILDDVNRLRLNRADDQDVLDLIRAFMGLNITLILVGVNLTGIGLLRKADWNKQLRQWVMPPLETTRIHGLEVTQTERRFELVEVDRFRCNTPEGMRAFVNHLRGLEVHLRLLNAKDGMLTDGGMPEYFRRRTGGVVGLIGRLVEDGSLEAMASGKEVLDESVLDGIVIGREDLAHAPDSEPETSARPASSPAPASKRTRGRNKVFDDPGPAGKVAS